MTAACEKNQDSLAQLFFSLSGDLDLAILCCISVGRAFHSVKTVHYPGTSVAKQMQCGAQKCGYNYACMMSSPSYTMIDVKAL